MLPATLPPTLFADEEQQLSQQGGAEVSYLLQNLESTEFNKTFTPKTDVSFGRDASACSVVYPDLGTLSRVHCKIFSLGREVFLEDLSSNGTFVNGKSVGKKNRRILRHFDVISLINPQLPESTKYSWKFISPDGGAIPAKSGALGALTSELERSYEVGATLGTGNFATVKLGTHRVTGQKVAVKLIDKKRFVLSQDEAFFTSLQSEVEILRKMKHRNIINVFDVFDDATQFAMVLELVSGGDFFDYIVGRSPSPFTESEGRALFIQLLEAMLYMHSKDIVHRDLKPENILVHVDPQFKYHDTGDKGRNARQIPVEKVTLKITDFGLAKFCTEQEVMTTMCGTPSYLAPEVLHPGDPAGKKAKGYGWSVDVWSLGIILFVLQSGTLPKVDASTGRFQFNKHTAHLSKECKDIIEAMLRVNPSERADLDEICNHAWLKGCHIEGRQLAVKQERLPLCGTMISPMQFTATLDLGTASRGDVTDGESDGEDEGKPSKKARTEDCSPASTSTPTTASKALIPVWYWKRELTLDDKNPTAWQAYSEEECDRIEKAKLRGAKSSKVGNTGDYRISFEGMFQYSSKDITKQRPVKREAV